MTGLVRIESIEEAHRDDEALLSLPSSVAHAVDARSATFLWRHADGVYEVLAFNRCSPACAALYALRYAHLDPWVKVARASPRRGELLCLGDYVPAAALEKSRLYREFIRPRGDDTYHAAVAVFDGVGGEAIVCLHRGRSEAPFAPSDVGPLGDRLPALGRMLRARGEALALRRRELVRRDDLDSLSLGALVVGADGALARVNLVADQVLRRADGFRAGAGVLSGAVAESRARLQAALALATAPDNPMATAIPVERTGPHPAKNGRRPLAYMVSVTPLRGEGDQRLAMLVFRDPDSCEESLAGRLGALFRPGSRGPAAVEHAPKGPAAARVTTP